MPAFFDRQGVRSSFKAALIIVLLLLLLIPLGMIKNLVWERENRSDSAAAEIIGSAGGNLDVIGPVMILPYDVMERVYRGGTWVTEQKPGVIILDIGLPGIDGRKLCRQIKTDSSLGNPIIIAITGLDDPDLEEIILKEGADAFIAKPFEPKVLSDKIDQLFQEKAG